MINQIDIISDPNCPFCALGYLQLQQALKELGRQHIEIGWHPFSINSGLPPEGKDTRQNLKDKYQMSDAEIEAGYDRFKMQGEEFGFVYDFPKDKRVYPSSRAQQLIAFAPKEKRSEVHMELLKTFFSKSQNFNDIDVLVEIAKATGLDAEAARDAIETGAFENQVNQEIAYWQQQGVQGVPSFILDQKYFVSGAIGIDGFKKVIQQIEEQILAN